MSRRQLEFLIVWGVMLLSGLVVLYYVAAAFIPTLAQAVYERLMS